MTAAAEFGNTASILRAIEQARKESSDLVVLLLTFTLTVFVDLSVAVQVGVVVASLLFMRRMAEVTNVSAVWASWNHQSPPANSIASATQTPTQASASFGFTTCALR